nr:hypothetical protein [Tanacetum cinerariifolium]
MASMNTRLNIEKLDGNIVHVHGGLKQVGFKQLGPSVKTRVHGVHDEKLAQRRLKDKQPKEKTNTDCLVKEQKNEYQTKWKIKTGNILDSCDQRSIQQCMKSEVAKYLGVAGIQQQNELVDETNVTLFAKVRCFLIQSGLFKVFWAGVSTRSTYLVNRSPSSAIGFKKPIDMLGFFGWLASIKQWMLEPVKVKCIFLGYHKSIVGNKLLRLDGVTSKVVLYRNISFNESGKYKKTLIGSGVGTGSMQENVNQGAGLQEVQTQDLMDYQLACDREQHLACKLFRYKEDSNKAGLKYDMDARSDMYVLSNGCRKCSDDNDGYYWGIHQEGSLSRDCDVKKNGKWSCIYAVGSQEYQMVCMILDIASADVESRYELTLVAGIATGALVKDGSRSEVPTQVDVVAYRY